MSGHNKWSQIKRQKAVTDQKRGSLFTKLAKAIAVATKQGGKDLTSNFKLRLATEKAKTANMPNDNIERAIKRGSGELEGATIEEIVYEGYGPGGIALIISSATDNKNRTSSNIKRILSKYNGNLGGSGSVAWMFDTKGVIRVLKDAINDKEKFELKVIDAGAEDIAEEEEGYIIYTRINDLPKLKTIVEKEGIKIASSEIEMVPHDLIEIKEGSDKKKMLHLLEELELDDDVNNFFTNANL